MEWQDLQVDKGEASVEFKIRERPEEARAR